MSLLGANAGGEYVALVGVQAGPPPHLCGSQALAGDAGTLALAGTPVWGWRVGGRFDEMGSEMRKGCGKVDTMGERRVRMGKEGIGMVQGLGRGFIRRRGKVATYQ